MEGFQGALVTSRPPEMWPVGRSAGHAWERALNGDEAIGFRRNVPSLTNTAIVQLGVGAQFAMRDAQALPADVDLVSTHEPDHRDGRRMVEADIALGDMGVCPSLDADQLGSDLIRQRTIIWHAT